MKTGIIPIIITKMMMMQIDSSFYGEMRKKVIIYTEVLVRICGMMYITPFS